MMVGVELKQGGAAGDGTVRTPSLASCDSSRPSSQVSNSATSDGSSISSQASSNMLQSNSGRNPTSTLAATPLRPFPRFKSPSSPSRGLPTLATLKTSHLGLRDSFVNAPSTVIVVNPRHALMRSRRTSLPANLAQTTSYSVLAGVPGIVAYGTSGGNRMSVASVSSFESLPEEGETPASPVHDPQATIHAFPRQYPGPSPSGEGPLRNLSTTSLSPIRPNRPRSSSTQRYSLPTPPAYQGGFQSFVLPTSRPTSRPSSPLGRGGFEVDQKRLARHVARDLRESERSTREERRWRIALELRETERSYVGVLEEIDQFYYQPLLLALPVGDLARRRATSRPSAPQSMPTSPILRPTSTAIPFPPLDPLSPPTTQILARREIAEVFSNFPTVLDLSRVIRTTLDTHIPDRPFATAPVDLAVVTRPSGHQPELSSSVDTDLSISGPATPCPSPFDFEPTSQPVSRLTSSESREKRPAGPPLALGKALLPILPFLKSYSIFVSNFAASLSRISSLDTSLTATGPNGSSWEDRRRWQEFCEERKRMGAGRGLGLGGLLLSIVQRVPRYRLLLLDLLEFTERDHPDFGELQTAFQLVDQVATHLESQIQAHTNILQILVFQRSFSNLDSPLLVPGRRLLKSGPLRKLDRRGTDQDRNFFLFNDILVHASGGAPGPASTADATGEAPYWMHRKIKLEEITVVEIQDATEEGRRFGFEIRSREKSFALFADTLGDKLEWIQVIRKAIDDLMRDRRTLQRDADSERQHLLRRERRISMPVTAAAFTDRLLSLPTPFSLVTPRFDLVPPTPSISPGQVFVESPTPMSFQSTPNAFGPEFVFSTDLPPTLSHPLTHATSLPSITPLSAVHSLASTLATPSSEIVVELRVIDNYSAPVWVPDSKVDRCMRCAAGFGVLRRRHHCRLCGGVVCWACSTKTFVIPAHDEGELDRLARSCDRCYSSTFDSPTSDPLPSTILLSSSSSSPRDIAAPRLSPRDPSIDSLPPSSFSLNITSTPGREEKHYASVIAQLTALLSR